MQDILTATPWTPSADDHARINQRLDEDRKASQQRLSTVAAMARVADPTTTEASQEDLGIVGTGLDVVRGIGNGAAGFAQSLVGLADGTVELFGGDLVDDEVYKKNVFGEQKSFLGSLAKGITQWSAGAMTGGMLLNAVSKATGAFAAGTAARAVVGGATADFLAFHESEERLSNLIEGTPLANPVTEYLSAKEDDNFILGRIKNVAEGMFVGLGLKGVGMVFSEGLQRLKKGLGHHAPVPPAGPPKPTLVPQGPALQPKSVLNEAEAALDTLDLSFGTVVAKSNNLGGIIPEVNQILRQFQESELTEKVSATLVKRVAQTYERFIDWIHPKGTPLNGPQGLQAADAATMRQTFDEFGKNEGHHLTKWLDGMDSNPMVQRRTAAHLLAYRTVMDNVESAFHKFAQDVTMNPTVENLVKYKQAREWGVNLRQHYKSWRKGMRLGPAGRLDAIADYAKTAGKATDELMAGVSPEVRDLELLRSALDDPAARTLLRNEARMAAQAANPHAAMKVIGKTGMWDKINEWVVNALLSHPVVQSVNFLSNTAKLVMTPMERLAGGVITANMREIRASMNMVRASVESAWDALRMSAKSFQLGESIAITDNFEHMIPGLSRGADIAGAGRGAIKAGDEWEGTLVGMITNVIGETVRLPSRALTASDELFKQIHARTSLKMKAWELADDLELWKGGNAAAAKDVRWQSLVANANGKNNKQLVAEWLHGTMEDAFDGVGRLHGSTPMSKAAIAAAKEGTFSQPLGYNTPAGKVQRFVMEHPAARLFMPFIRTPVNLFREVRSRLPVFGQKSYEMKTWLESGDPTQVAKAYGRWASGMTLSVASLSAGASGAITGSGPTDPAELELKKSTGWRPYSIAVQNPDGSTRYVQYNRLDPVGSLIGFMADLSTVLMHTPDSPEKSELVGATGLAFANLFINKTYLKGMTDLLETVTSNDERKFQQYLGQTGSGIMIPSFVRWLSNDPQMREVRDMTSAFLSKTPGYGNVPPKRNILGEVINATGGTMNLAFTDDAPTEKNRINSISPFAYSRTLPGDVMQELVGLGKTFAKASPDEDGLDLRTVRNSSGRVAYDRMQELTGTVEIRGKTLRQALTEFVKSDAYDRIKSADATRQSAADAISDILSRYRGAARREMYKEFPSVVTHRQNVLRDLRDGFVRENQRRRSAMGLDDFVRSLQ